MDLLGIILIVIIICFVLGGMAYPRSAEGPPLVNGLLYLLAFIVLLIVLFRVVGVR
jgi:hypothetical protein